MTRSMVPAALALGILATSLPSAAQPARLPAPPPPANAVRVITVDGARKVVTERSVDGAGRTTSARAMVIKGRRALRSGATSRRREKLAQLTDEQVAAQLKELIRKASVNEDKWYQASMEAKDVREAHDAAPDEQKPDLFVLRLETGAKSRVLQREKQQLDQSVKEMIQEQSRRHRKRIEEMTNDQLKAHLRDSVARRNAAKRRCDDLKATAHSVAGHAAALELSQLDQEVRDAENAYYQRLMAQ